jgi:CMP-N-acetylneuraminic acid synthetase
MVLKPRLKYVALIPLRGGSKSIPLKNIKVIAGRPLCYWVLKACTDSGFFKEIIVSTDSEEIRRVVVSLNLPVRVLNRPAELASDESSTESVMLHALPYVDCDVLVTVQATSPLLTADDLVRAKAEFEQGNFTSLLTAVRTKRFFWSDDFRPINYDPSKRPRRQDFDGTLMENGAFYFTNARDLAEYKCRLLGKIGIYEMNELSAVEIDEPKDWSIVESLLLQKGTCS